MWMFKIVTMMLTMMVTMMMKVTKSEVSGLAHSSSSVQACLKVNSSKIRSTQSIQFSSFSYFFSDFTNI